MDHYETKKIELQLRFMEDQGYLLSHTSVKKIDGHGVVFDAVSATAFSGIVFPESIAACPISITSVMGSSKIFRQYTFPTKFEHVADICLWIVLTSKFALGAINQALANVTVMSNSPELDKYQKANELMNVCSFVIEDKFFRQFESQIHRLLETAAKLFSESNPPQINDYDDPVAPEFSPARNMVLSKILSTLRDEGLRVTWLKSKRRLRMLIDSKLHRK